MAFKNFVCVCVDDGERLRVCQVREVAESMLEEMEYNFVQDPPLEGDLMRQIYISLNHPLPTITNKRWSALHNSLVEIHWMCLMI